MDRAEQLRKLSREHHTSLVFARTMAKVAEKGIDEELTEAIQKVTDYYNDELEVHFQHEEHTIFKLLFQEYREHIELATKLVQEHGAMRMLIPTITLDTAKKDLEDFATVLTNHTHAEERVLFPIIEKIFSDEQLDAVLNFKPLD